MNRMNASFINLLLFFSNFLGLQFCPANFSIDPHSSSVNQYLHRWLSKIWYIENICVLIMRNLWYLTQNSITWEMARNWFIGTVIVESWYLSSPNETAQNSITKRDIMCVTYILCSFDGIPCIAGEIAKLSVNHLLNYAII